MTQVNDSRGVFDQLNEALFAQLDKLQSIDPRDTEKMAQAIEQSKVVSQLAGNIIGNASTAISLMKFQAQAGDTLENRAATTPKMLTGRY